MTNLCFYALINTAKKIMIKKRKLCQKKKLLERLSQIQKQQD